jgi:ADP-heptose:LPS heptosyltransferase
MRKILIFKQGAMGDFFCAVPAFAAIREKHPNDHITLVTSGPYVDLAHSLGYFDEILRDPRPRLYQVNLIHQFRSIITSVDMVYDLQCRLRTTAYRLLGLTGHYVEWLCMPWDLGLRAKLTGYSVAEMPPFRPADFSNFSTDLASLGIKPPFALIVPGSSKLHADDKRWPLENYLAVADHFYAKGLHPVLVGGPDEDFSASLPDNSFFLDISGKTSLADMVGITKAASFAVGNDTGLMHLAALCEIPLIVLMSGTRPPERSAQGPYYMHLVRTPISSLSVSEVVEAFDMLCLDNKRGGLRHA